MALLRGQCHRAIRVQLLLCFLLLFTFLCAELRHTAKVFYDRATLLQLRGHSYFGLFDPNTLQSYPELTCYVDSTLGRPPTGSSPESNGLKWRHSRREG